MIINLVTTGKANFPIWFEAHSGNISDKNIIPQAANKIREYCKEFIGAPNFIYLGD